MRAYDLEMLKRPADRASPNNHGWCFGLPPGITATQWPLDPNNGFPLMHGFTLLLPEDYRCHGPDIVALSFFATSPDLNDGAPLVFPDIKALLEADAPRPSDQKLAAFWDHFRTPRPNLFRMLDILECAYAVILLTRAAFDGPLCHPPELIDADRSPQPEWLTANAAATFHKGNLTTRGTMPDADHPVVQMLGEYPDGDVSFDRAIRWAPRAHDPNAGLAPQERWAQEKSGYQPEWIEVDGEPVQQDRPWMTGFAPMHIGGTMRPTQNIPDGFSPYYVEFDEELGGYNFGFGNAQLDFKQMKFDWACG